MPILRLAVVALATLAVLPAQPVPGGARDFAVKLREQHKIPGLAVAVAKGGRIAWTEGFGYANLEWKVPVDAETRFRLGSVSKLFTAAIAVRLHEAGKLDLDADVTRYVPAFPAKASPVRIRHLLGHTGGVRHYGDQDPVFRPGYSATLADGLKIFAADPLLFEPGSKYEYTSYGYNLLGAALENAGGADFLTLLAEQVAKPLGLASVAGDAARAIVEKRTGFYEVTRDGAVRQAAPVDNGYKWPSGGILAAAPDVARFAAAHLHPGFLKPETLAVMFTSQKLTSGAETGVGLGWRIAKDPQGKRVYHHGGTIDGGRAMVMVYPDHDVVVVLLANTLARFGEKEAMDLAQFFLN